MRSRPTTRQIIEWLSDPAVYPHQPESVEIRETHASVAFLAGNDVYKLKKPVDFGFLDYSTLGRRRELCRLEVDLNRRLAPDVYLGVENLTHTDNGVTIGGDGPIVDYLVHMRRLPDDRSLETGVRANQTKPEDIDAIAEALARFHQTADRGPAISRFGNLDTVAHNVEENFEQVAPYVEITIPRTTYTTITAYARHFIEEHQDLFARRVKLGLICDGHGDLRAEHVYLLPDDEIKIIDCIEFNDRLRYGDVAVDLGFLVMDLDALGRPDLSRRLVTSYERKSGYDLSPVLDFYCCYRAYVRGKVTTFRLDLDGQHGTDERSIRLEARRFFHLAHRYATADHSPQLLIMCGLTGSGKSTLARELADVIGAAVIDSDTTRKRLVGLAPTDRQEEAYGAGIYSSEISERVYQNLLRQAESLLHQGRRVILDATYIRRKDRESARDVAARYDAAFLCVYCEVSDHVARQRLAAREGDPQRVSDGRWEIYVQQQQAFEPMSELEEDQRLTVDAERPIIDQIEAVVGKLETQSRKPVD